MVPIRESIAADCGRIGLPAVGWKYSNHKRRVVKTLNFLRKAIGSLLCILVLNGCGEKFTDEGNALGKAINEHLIAQMLCKDYADCKNKVEIYGGHGNQVNFTAYAVKDPRLVYALIGFVASEGMRITKGVPISLSFYPKPRASYREIFDFSEPNFKLEVKK